MSTVHVYNSVEELAHAAAEKTISILRNSIDRNGQASWVLAGGTTPMAAYAVIANTMSDALDWSKVTLLLGDERIGEPEGEFNNWHAINRVIGGLPTRNFVPLADVSAEESAADYANHLNILPRATNGLPLLDLVWLGVGEDGHTLSIFPNHPSLFPSSSLIIPVHDSPKPPSDRISLSLRALQGAGNAMILVSGSTKQPAVQSALSGNNSPIALASSIIETHEGSVSWLLDKSAAPTD